MTLADLRSQMEAKVQSEYLERYRGIWTDAEIKRTASIVTVGAIKYGMLKVDNNTAVNFDINEWLRLDGDTGPYLQYVYARCRNILEKQANPATPPDPEASQAAVKEFLATGHQLVETIEQELLLALTRYFDALRQSAELLRPTFVATYLFELARTFNRFYEQCSIKESSGALRLSRLELVAATASVMAHGLDVLGIEAPERM
jgi:arginyl-tRNA synthetase